MVFEFNQQLMPQNILDIEQPGQCAIEASDDEGNFYYLVIKSSLGLATVCTCGPVYPDIIKLPSGCTCSLERIKSEDKKVNLTIQRFLNSNKITDAKVIDIEDALNQFRDIGEYMKHYGEGDIY